MLHVLLNALLGVLIEVKVAIDGRRYLVLDGRWQCLPTDAITLVHDEEPQASGHNNKKEGSKMLYHFLKTHPVLGEIRVITNSPTVGRFVDGEYIQGEVDKYHQSLNSKMPVDGLFAVNSGNWKHHLLIERALNKGVKFRLSIAQNGCINPSPWAPVWKWKKMREAWKGFVNKSNFAWANAGSSFFLQFPGVTEWGLSPLGMEAIHAPKSSKRNLEVTRDSELALYTEDINGVKIGVANPDIDSIAVDGMTYITESFALKTVHKDLPKERRLHLRWKIRSGKMKRFNGRILVPKGKLTQKPLGCLIKGDISVVPDHCLNGYDIVTVEENLKDEIRPTDQFIMVTLHDHHATYEATWDVQRLVMNPQILTHAHRMRDLDNLAEDSVSFIDSGELPEWLLLQGEDAHDADVSNVRESYEDYGSILDRWQAAGLDPRCSQNGVTMAFGAIINRMARDFDSFWKGEARGNARTMWLPMSNAMCALINTHGSLTMVGGLDTGRDGLRAYFMAEYGIILPSERMVALYNLIGGGDLDDSVQLQLVKLWSSDPAKTQMMRDNGVIDTSEIIPENAEDAKYCASVLRSPNGAGEFAFIEIEDILDLPWQMLDLDNVEVIDIAKLPLPQGEMLARSHIQGIQSSLTYSRKPFSRDDAVCQILAQQENPGVGQAANAMMAWVGVNGPSMPPVIVAAFEQLVDGVQQLSDPAIFKAVREAAASTSGQAIELLVNGGRQVDSYLVERFAGKEDKQIAAQYSYNGPLSEFQEEYRKVIKDLHTAVLMQSLQMRRDQVMVQWLRGLNFEAAKPFAKEFIDRYESKINRTESRFRAGEKDASGIRKITLQAERHNAVRAIIDEAIAELNTFERPAQRALSLWWYMVQPTRNNPMGVKDRLVFQQGTNGTIADLFIPRLIERQGEWKKVD